MEPSKFYGVFVMRMLAFLGFLGTTVSAALAFWDAPKLEELPSSDKAIPIVFIAGKPEAKPTGDHEYFAGCALLANTLRQTPNVHPILVKDGWPKDEKVFQNAKAIVFYLSGDNKQAYLEPEKLKVIEKAVSKGVGLVHLHNCIEYPADRKNLALEWTGGVYEKNLSCRGHWVANIDQFEKHEITRGVTPFNIDEGWLFHMNFLPNGVKPLVMVNPPEKMRTTASAKKNAPNPETVGWAYETTKGNRAFTFTGGHAHSNWEKDGLRQLVVNGILWSAGLTIPEKGAPNKLAPEDLKANLQNKPAPKKK